MPTTRRGALPRRRLGAAIGGGFGVAVVAGLLLPGNAHLSAPGRMNSGHEQLDCDGCHRPAPGTVRQQLQANTRYVLGLRAQPADFGERAVGNDDWVKATAPHRVGKRNGRSKGGAVSRVYGPADTERTIANIDADGIH